MRKIELSSPLSRITLGLIVLLASCTPATSSAPPATFPHTLQAQSTDTPSLTPTQPRATPTAVGLREPVPLGGQVITNMNANHLALLASWGNGIPGKVRYSPSGRVLGVLSSTGIGFYDTETNQRTVFVSTNTPPRDASFSPSGHAIALATVEGIQLLDVNDGRLLAKIEQGADSIAYAPSGASLAASTQRFPCSSGNQIDIYDLSTLAITTTLETSSCVNDLAFSPDARLLAASQFYGVTVWPIGAPEALVVLPPGPISKQPYAVAFSPDGTLLAIATYAYTYLYDVSTWKIIAELQPPRSPTYDLAFSPNGGRLVTVSDAVYIWDVATGSRLAALRGNFVHYGSVSWSSEPGLLATSSDFPATGAWPEVTIWDADTLAPLLAIEDFTNEVDALEWLPDGERIAVAYGNGGLRVVALADGRVSFEANYRAPFASLGHKQAFYTLAVSPDGTALVADLYFTGGLIMASLDNPSTSTQPAEPFTVGYFGPAYSPSGEYLAAFRNGSPVSLQVWELPELRLVTEWVSRRGRIVVAPTFSSDNETIFFATADEWGQLYEWIALGLAEGTTASVITIPIENQGFQAVALSPREDRIALGSVDGSVLISSPGHSEIRSACAPTRIPRTLDRPPSFIAWSRDASVLAFGLSDGRMCLIDAQNGRVLASFRAHTGFIHTVSFSPDGRLIATASKDGTVSLWGIQR